MLVRTFGQYFSSLRPSALALLLCWAASASGQIQILKRPLTLRQTHYRLRAGERIALDAPQETIDFIRRAKKYLVAVNGAQEKGIVVGQNASGDQIVLAASLASVPGEYAVTFSAIDESGQGAETKFSVSLDPMQPVPSTATRPPVVLLNGWQILYNSNSGDFGSCPISSGPSDTFGSLSDDLVQADGVPVVYFFDNCVEDENGSIEDLGSVLGQVLNLIRFDTGVQVPAVDVVAHSMGGLIVRSYLTGLQANGTLSPPLNPRVRKFIEIATPNFGSFLAANVSNFIPAGTQSAEMIPGSAFLWELATWNQGRIDDLRGVDALAIIGDEGTWSDGLLGQVWSHASDGVVSLTSASLSFARDNSRTRILPHCHIDSASLAGHFINCNGDGIAKASDTLAAVRSFLKNDTAWMSIGGTPAADVPGYGGVYLGVENASAQYASDLTQVQFGGVGLSENPQYALFYGDFLPGGQGTIQFDSTSLGGILQATGTAAFGTYTPFRVKVGPFISLVTPLLNASALEVASGQTITINGYGFGQQCATCQVLAYPGPVQLQISTWTDSALSAYLPATFNGFTQLVIQAASGSDIVNVMAQSPPSISISPTQVQLAYTTGGALPAPTPVIVSNSGGGALNWSATSGVPWLTVSTVPAGFTISLNATGLAPGPYAGTISVTAPGALNSPQTVAVSLTVMAPPMPPSISLSTTQASFTYTVGGALPSPQTVSISNSGGGTLAWSATPGSAWISVSSGTNLLSISVQPSNLSPGPYTGTIAVTGPGASNNPQTITVKLTVNPPASTVVVSGIVNAASGATAAAVAPGEMVTIVGTGLGPSAGTTFSLDPLTKTVSSTLAGTRVLFGGLAAPITYASATQINAVVPYEIAGQTSVSMQVQYQGAQSASTALQVANASPGVFTVNSSGTGQAVAADQDGSFNGPSTPATKGSYVTIYFTGGGQTNPPAVTGSVSGSNLQWLAQNISVTVGGVPADVEFDGAAPGLVAGVYQLNIHLTGDTPSGPQEALIVNTGGVSSRSTATLAVQ